MSWMNNWKHWEENECLELELKEQLNRISTDKAQLEDCFYKYLEFGTGGMRGEMGPGTNRMNIFTIRRAALGLARYIEGQGEASKSRGVAIAYDSRYRSFDFAMETALTLGALDIQVYLFHDLRPTPELSYAVRKLKAAAGVMITASHNPPEYNGFKVYGEDGGQFPPGPAEALIEKVNEIEDELAIQTANENEMKASGKLKIIGEEIDTEYNNELQTICVNPEIIQKKGSNISIVFTPLHGTANEPVKRVLETSGFTNVHVVKEQATPDPEFSTVKSPNPEDKDAFELAKKEGKKRNADILIAADPDADRIGIAVKDQEGQYQLLTGNQTGALMLEYLLSERQAKGYLPENGVMLKTIVTSELGKAIAESYDVKVVDTLTGFKFIAEKIKQYEKDRTLQFQFGYEESYGYLISDFVRDKDAVQASLIAAEMTLWYKEKDKTLYDGLEDIYEKYGYYLEDLESLTFKGKEGVKKIENIITAFRNEAPKAVGDKRVIIAEDYQTSERSFIEKNSKEKIELPVSNVLKYITEGHSWFCIRPSGTEPKIKFYFGVKESSQGKAEEELSGLKKGVMDIVNQYT